jgi:hypothetical protein
MDEYFKRKRFWYYCRKCIFIMILPSILALFSLFDINYNDKNKNPYKNIYFYTTFILFIYAMIGYFITYINDVYAVDVLFSETKNKELVILKFEPNNNDVMFIVIKRVFRLRYAHNFRYTMFKYISKLCWIVGIDAPVLIPYDVIAKLSSCKDTITIKNENEILGKTINNLYTYNPSWETYGLGVEEQLLPHAIMSNLDRSIGEIQGELLQMRTN